CDERLEAWARTRFPKLRDVAWRWTGRRLEPADGLALAGRAPGVLPGVFVIAGGSGVGLVQGAPGAVVGCCLVSYRGNPPALCLECECYWSRGLLKPTHRGAPQPLPQAVPLRLPDNPTPSRDEPGPLASRPHGRGRHADASRRPPRPHRQDDRLRRVRRAVVL